MAVSQRIKNMNTTLLVVDDFLPNPVLFRENVLKQDFVDLESPIDGEVYKRVAIGRFPYVEELIESAVGFKISMLLSGVRLNFNGELPNSSIHADLSYGEFAAIIYLSRPEDCRGGTAFWRHKESGWDQLPAYVGTPTPESTDVLKKVQPDWDKRAAWQLVTLTGMKFNRFICYPTRFFHSRYPFEAFGTNPENGRLIFVAFFNRA